MNIAIIGATGLAGRELLKLLFKRNFKHDNLRLFASPGSAGKVIEESGRKFTVEGFSADMFEGQNIAFFAVDGKISRELLPQAQAENVVVIDKSSAFRMEDGVPLVIPEVNWDESFRAAKLIACPNCSTTIMCMALWPLHKAAGLRRVVATTLQSISGAGSSALAIYEAQMKGASSGSRHPFFDNVIPHIDDFDAVGISGEERKMVEETRKIFGLPKLKISATCVRVPVVRGHSISVNAEFESWLTPDVARMALESFDGVTCMDDPSKGGYPTPNIAANEEDCFVGRIRQDESRENALSFFVSGDNLWKGAALNALEIAEKIVG